MASEKVFQDVLKYVAQSRLNFSILHTPFSAQLSLKKSFATNFHDKTEPCEEASAEFDETNIWKKRSMELEKRLTNLDLKGTVAEKEIAIHNLENKCKTLEDSLKVEKKRNKKERQRSEKTDFEKQENSIIKEENFSNKRNGVDVSNVQIFNKFETLTNYSSDQHENSIAQTQEHFSQTDSIQCNFCSTNFLSETNLKNHVIQKHRPKSEAGSQTCITSKISRTQQTVEERKGFEPYNCFYCQTSILSETLLISHAKTCHGQRSSSVNHPAMNIRKSESKKEPDLNEAFQTYLLHYQEVNSRKFQCEICHEIFNSESLLGMHSYFKHARLKLD